MHMFFVSSRVIGENGDTLGFTDNDFDNGLLMFAVRYVYVGKTADEQEFI